MIERDMMIDRSEATRAWQREQTETTYKPPNMMDKRDFGKDHCLENVAGDCGRLLFPGPAFGLEQAFGVAGLPAAGFP